MDRQFKRIEWVDVAKFICILSVILSHLESNTDFLMAFYSPFFLTMFFFTSGYVYQHKGVFRSLLISKVRGLLIPWLVFSLFIILLSQILSFNEQGSLLNELKWNFLQIRGKGDELWFVAALFVAYFPFYFLVSLYERRRNSVALILIAVVITYVGSVLYTTCMSAQDFPWDSVALPWHIEYIPQAVLFMFLGYLFRGKLEETFNRNITNITMVVLCFVYLAAVYIPFFFAEKMPSFVAIIHEHIMKPFGICVMILLCKRIKINRYISFVGSNTLIYFALHGKVYSLGQTIIKKIGLDIYEAILGNTLMSSVFAIVFTILISLILIPPAVIVNRFCPFAVGKKVRR